jgi:hypothetical protein
VYVVDYNERNHTTQENTRLLPKEENGEAIVPSKLRKECDLPPSPPAFDYNYKIEYALDNGLSMLDNLPCLENLMYMRMKMINFLVVMMLSSMRVPYHS